MLGFYRFKNIRYYFSRHYHFFILLSLMAAFGVGWYVGRVTKQTLPPNQVLREEGYQYIKPVLLCSVNNTNLANEDMLLEKNIKAYISSAPEKDIAAYFLELNTGKWAGVNENETFTPASMLKVPTM